MLPEGTNLLARLREEATTNLTAAKQLAAFDSTMDRYGLDEKTGEVLWRFVLVTGGYNFDTEPVEDKFKNMVAMVKYYRGQLDGQDPEDRRDREDQLRVDH